MKRTCPLRRRGRRSSPAHHDLEPDTKRTPLRVPACKPLRTRAFPAKRTCPPDNRTACPVRVYGRPFKVSVRTGRTLFLYRVSGCPVRAPATIRRRRTGRPRCPRVEGLRPGPPPGSREPDQPTPPWRELRTLLADAPVAECPARRALASTDGRVPTEPRPSDVVRAVPTHEGVDADGGGVTLSRRAGWTGPAGSATRRCSASPLTK
jgi:hypothetical protein